MDNKLLIGAHMSISGGYAAMLRTALSIGANTLQYFTRNPRGGDARALDEADIAEAHKIADENGLRFSDMIAHAAYTVNPCSAKENVREFAIRSMTEDIERLEYFPGTLYNFHPGTHTGQGAEVGIALTAHCLATVVKPEQKTRVLIETMSGKGSEIGATFEEVRAIIDAAESEAPAIAGKLGVCLDTCHVSDAGYDIAGNPDAVLDEFDRVIGLDRLCAIHLNDSKNPLGAHKDRHEVIGGGTLGLDAIARIINTPRIKHLPFCLETPNELDGYRREIELLRGLYIQS